MLQPSVVDLVSATCVGSTPKQRRELGPHLVAHAERPREVRLSPAPLRDVDELLGDHRLGGDTRERAVRARIQVRVLLEDGEGGADLLEAGHGLV